MSRGAGEYSGRPGAPKARDPVPYFRGGRRLPLTPKTPNMVNAPAGAIRPAAFANSDPHSRLTMNLAARTVLVVIAAVVTVGFVWAFSRIRPIADVDLPAEPVP